MKGYIYILGNKSFKDEVYKIGLTTSSVDERARQLSSLTGLPLPFEVLYKKEVEDVFNLEAWVHSKLWKYRVSKDREFFKASFDLITKTIEECLSARIPAQADRKYFATDQKDYGLLKIWNQVGQKAEATKCLEKRLPFYDALIGRILSLGTEISLQVAPGVLQFDDGLLGLFYGIEPQVTKIVVAPLRLTPQNLKGIDCSFRDISQKKYSMGGLVRVDLFQADQKDLDLAVSLAKLSYESTEKIITWNVFGNK